MHRHQCGEPYCNISYSSVLWELTVAEQVKIIRENPHFTPNCFQMALPKHLIICNFLIMWKCKTDLHFINILNVICPSSEATCRAYPPPRCLSCCLVHCPLCGLLCVNHDSFCGSVTLVSEVHREAALAFSLAEFPLWRIVVWSSCFVLEVKESALITASLHGLVWLNWLEKLME